MPVKPTPPEAQLNRLVTPNPSPAADWLVSREYNPGRRKSAMAAHPSAD